MYKQPQKAKIGEVQFRQKLILQHLGQISYFPGVPNSKQILQLLKERIKNTTKILNELTRKKVALSPFLEIGAEKGQRSALLTSKFDAIGFALDLSFESLKTTKIFAKKLLLDKSPVLICADAENLPFADSSIPFVFAFETLHHFPKPDLAIAEMKRVCSLGGHVYFSEEPVKNKFNLGLWRRDFNLTPFEKILKVLLILPFISKLGGAEHSHSVIENEFSISDWKQALSIFEKPEVTVEPVFWGPKSTFIAHNQSWPVNPLTKLLIDFEGGGITIFAKMTGNLPKFNKDILLLLRCPICKKSPLSKLNSSLECRRCKANYPIRDDVLIILPPKQRGRLYPEI